MGHNRFNNIDDAISGHRTKQLACIVGHRQKSDLTRAGFIFSEKCNWEPDQIGVWLGLIIDAIRFEDSNSGSLKRNFTNYVLNWMMRSLNQDLRLLGL